MFVTVKQILIIIQWQPEKILNGDTVQKKLLSHSKKIVLKRKILHVKSKVLLLKKRQLMNL